MLWAVTLNIQCLYRERKVLNLPFSYIALCNDISAICSSNSHSLYFSIASCKCGKGFIIVCSILSRHLIMEDMNGGQSYKPDSA